MFELGGEPAAVAGGFGPSPALPGSVASQGKEPVACLLQKVVVNFVSYHYAHKLKALLFDLL